MMKVKDELKDFYESVDRNVCYATATNEEDHPFYQQLTEFLGQNHVKDWHVLEIGSGKGIFRNLVDHYVGVDIAHSLFIFYPDKKYIVASAEHLAVSPGSFDCVVAYAVHEHVHDFELSLLEILRVLKPGGICLFAPAWYTRPWFAEGLDVRKYKDLTAQQKVLKAILPIRDSRAIRWPLALLGRLFRGARFLLRNDNKRVPLRYKKLRPNYSVFWRSDSDACNSIDPFDVILWLRARDIVCIGYERWFDILLVRSPALRFRKPD